MTGRTMPKAAFKQADVARLVRGAIDGGMPVGSFALQLVNGQPALVPIDQPVRVDMKMTISEEDPLADIQRLIKLHG